MNFSLLLHSSSLCIEHPEADSRHAKSVLPFLLSIPPLPLWWQLVFPPLLGIWTCFLPQHITRNALIEGVAAVGRREPKFGSRVRIGGHENQSDGSISPASGHSCWEHGRGHRWLALEGLPMAVVSVVRFLARKSAWDGRGQLTPWLSRKALSRKRFDLALPVSSLLSKTVSVNTRNEVTNIAFSIRHGERLLLKACRCPTKTVAVHCPTKTVVKSSVPNQDNGQ
ncbi:hypothetical protein BCR39DRAFT_528022 [Naematelia encephala]|uniref:Uncharacterized protein n=1 Tax=Naematelia encephala TaxID=71784 RepID=A0A1Y2B955_9TREE|nr:hypothetical protein BCR39DRAFT_528022 [Naematelia encephala]